jgi:hypothetical protein
LSERFRQEACDDTVTLILLPLSDFRLNSKMSIDDHVKSKISTLISLLIALCWTSVSFAQDLEPRRWSQMPTGLNFIGLGYGYVNGDIYLDPVLKAEDVTFELHRAGLVYVRSLNILGKSSRIDFTLPYAAGRWQGTVDDVFTSIRRRGLGDARVRLSTLLYGGPAETPQEFAKSKKSNTVVGAAVGVSMPTGQYTSKYLINLGSGRWVIRPQLGVTHTRGKLTGELTSSVFLYTDNNDFWQGTELETDPLFALQAHVIYTFRPGLWTSLSTDYGWGGEATVSGDAKNNPSGNWLSALSFGFPIDKRQGVKLTYLRGRTQKPTGADNDSLILGWSMMF